jgi:ceramide glucosyltransferase
MLEVLIACVALGAAFSLVVVTLTEFCVWSVAARPIKIGPTPGVSVLKPVKGVDEGLLDNLRSIAGQDYPNLEILIGAADPDDPALAIARQVRREYPQVSIRAVVTAQSHGLNPKVANLRSLCKETKHDWILISDSNVRVDSGYVRAIASETRDPRVKLVSSVIAGVGERSLGALLENLQLASFVAGSVCGASLLAGHPCVVGKSMLMRQSVLETLGGWGSVQDVLAEDYLLGKRFHDAGHRVALSSHVVHTINEQRGVREFLSRHLRWAQMRRRISPLSYAFEPLMYVGAWQLLLLGLLVVAAPGTSRSLPLAAFALSALVLRAVLSQITLRVLRGRSAALTDLAWVAVKDVMMAAVWVVGGLRRTVSWRGERLRIGAGSVLRRREAGHSVPRRAWAGHSPSSH